MVRRALAQRGPAGRPTSTTTRDRQYELIRPVRPNAMRGSGYVIKGARTVTRRSSLASRAPGCCWRIFAGCLRLSVLQALMLQQGWALLLMPARTRLALCLAGGRAAGRADRGGAVDHGRHLRPGRPVRGHLADRPGSSVRCGGSCSSNTALSAVGRCGGGESATAGGRQTAGRFMLLSECWLVSGFGHLRSGSGAWVVDLGPVSSGQFDAKIQSRPSSPSCPTAERDAGRVCGDLHDAMLPGRTRATRGWPGGRWSPVGYCGGCFGGYSVPHAAGSRR